MSPKLRFIDFEIQWIAVQDMTVTRTNHSLFSIRAAGKSVTLRYRVVLHAGDHKDAGLDAVYKAWSQGAG